MVYQSLYRKWRPQTFDEIAGQPHVTQTLKNAIEQSRVSHAYLFSGPRGTGKTTTARILAKAINCEKGPTAMPCGVCNSCKAITDGSSMDVLELDAASNRKVDEIREFLEKIPYSAAEGRKKVYIIDEVHMLTTESFNTLLKTLEEPPEHVIFILATTEPHKVLPTILSRCQRFDFRRISISDIVKRLRAVAEAESISIDDTSLTLIADHVQGAMRDALGILEQLSLFTNESISASDVNALLGISDTELLYTFTNILTTGDLGDGLVFIDELVSSGLDVRQFIQDELSYLRDLFLIQSVPTMHPGAIPDELMDKFTEQAKSVPSQSLSFFINTLNEVYNQSRWANDIRLILEIALFKMIRSSSDMSREGILHRIERLESAVAGIGKEPPAPATSTPAKSAKTVDSGKAKPVKESAESTISTDASSPEPVSKKSKKKPNEQDIAATVMTDNLPDISDIRNVWPQVLALIKEKKKSRYSFFAGAKPLRIDQDHLVLRVKEHEKLFIENPENLQMVRNSIKIASGYDIPVICEVEKAMTKTVTVNEREITPDEILEVDDYIKLVQDAFGAKIVEEIKIQED